MRLPASALSHLECARCGRTHSKHEIHGSCDCGGPLLCRYRIDKLRQDLRREDIAVRPPGLWRFAELLPAQNPGQAVTLGEGTTPLIPLRWGERNGVPDIWLKDEGQNPTGSFKARGAAVSVTCLHELGVHQVVVSSSGNAGDAWAVYCRRAGIEATIILPDDAPEPMLVETVLAGQALYTFGGHNSRGGRLARGFAAAQQVFCANTFQEAYRIEGKKTMGLELAEQLGWRMPDVLVYPIGGGVGLLGIWKAFEELVELGWIEGRMPRIVVAQYDGCAPFVEAVAAGREACEPWPDVVTLPGGLRNPKSAGDFMVLDVIRRSGGSAIAVSSGDALDAVRDLMASDGVFVCPEAGAAMSALRTLAAEGKVGAEETVAVINTATGLKYAALFDAPHTRLADGAEVI